MVVIKIFIANKNDDLGTQLPDVAIDQWNESDGVDVVHLRRYLMDVVMKVRHTILSLFELDAEKIVGIPTKTRINGDDLYLIYETEQELHSEKVSCTWSNMTPVRSFASHFGSLPEYPALQVLTGARHCFNSLMALKTEPVTAVLRRYRQELSDTSNRLWHYSRFTWNEVVDQFWCKTFFFYCSPDKTGPLNLYPLNNERNLLSVNPSNSKDSNFCPNYVCCHTSIDNEDGPDVLIVIEDLLMELTNVILNPEWEDFCKICELHGLAAPTPDFLLECGMEKALIPIVYFFPFAPVVGFTYTHDFSSVPEPRTICLTAPAASKWLQISSVDEDKSDSAEMLLFADVCSEESSTSVSKLDSISDTKLQELFIARFRSINADTPVGQFLRENHRKEAVLYLKERLSKMSESDIIKQSEELFKAIWEAY